MTDLLIRKGTEKVYQQFIKNSINVCVLLLKRLIMLPPFDYSCKLQVFFCTEKAANE